MKIFIKRQAFLGKKILGSVVYSYDFETSTKVGDVKKFLMDKYRPEKVEKFDIISQDFWVGMNKENDDFVIDEKSLNYQFEYDIYVKFKSK